MIARGNELISDNMYIYDHSQLMHLNDIVVRMGVTEACAELKRRVLQEKWNAGDIKTRLIFRNTQLGPEERKIALESCNYSLGEGVADSRQSDFMEMFNRLR